MNPQPVWSSRVGADALALENIHFCAGYDVRGREAADARLAAADLATNAAHLVMLAEQEIVPRPAAAACARALLALRDKLAAGQQLLRPACEDIHMSVESAVAEIAGADAAGHLHTARSRNDQVATDMRLWLRGEVAAVVEELLALFDAIAAHARSHAETACPGFTHGQPAMITTWGHWTMSYLPRLVRDMRAAAALMESLGDCPLGAAASFGTAWGIDRDRTAQLLGFARPSPSGADAIWSRGELEGRFAQLAAQILAHLSGIAQDIILLSSPPRTWLRLDDAHVTGSSIMPQKRNPDFAEVTRSRAHVAAGIAHSLLSIATALPSGYNRDTQWTKYLAFDAADNLRGAAPLFAQAFGAMRVDAAAMRAACREGFLNATDAADLIARTRRVPFRACYKLIGAAVKASEAAGELQLPALNAQLAAAKIDPLSQQEWDTLSDPVLLLAARNQPGNPAPARVAESIDILRADMMEAVGGIARLNVERTIALERLGPLLEALAASA